MLNPFKRFRIDYLLFGSFGLFIIALLTAITWVNYSMTTKEMAERTSLSKLDLLNELSKQLQFKMDSFERTSLVITKNIDEFKYLSLRDDPYSQLIKQTYMDTVLNQFIYSNANIHSMDIYIDDPTFLPTFKGQIRYHSLEQAEDKPMLSVLENQDHSWLTEHVMETEQGDVRVISFARKFYSSTGQYYGLLILHVEAKAIRELIQGESLEPNRTVLDIRGQELTSVGKTFMQDAWEELLPEMMNSPGSDQLTVGGKRDGAFLTWSISPTGEWVLVESIPWSQITGPITASTKWMLTIGLAAILVGLGFALLFSKQFLKPIYFLVKYMDNFHPEEARKELPADYYNEYAYMFRGYQRLIDRVDQLYASLKEQYSIQRETEIKALQAMINPHFLYNTLDQANWFAIKSGQSEISHMLSLMGKMFRIGLSNGRSFITIDEELKHIELYMQIQQFRWKGELSWEIQMEGPLGELYIPKLTLQPFVENAVLHGFRARGGHIRIVVEQQQHDLLITLTDNGVGLSSNWGKKPGNMGGYGIRNVKERLHAFFGDKYGIRMISPTEGGTRVLVRIPMIHDTSPYERDGSDVEDRDCG